MSGGAAVAFVYLIRTYIVTYIDVPILNIYVRTYIEYFFPQAFRDQHGSRRVSKIPFTPNIVGHRALELGELG